MKCPLCNIEMAIKKSTVRVRGDDSQDTETEVYRELELSCRNKQCSNFEKTVKTVINPMPLSGD